MPPTLKDGKICYVEFPAVDANRSADFYAKVFGWGIRKRGDGKSAFDDSVGEVSGTWVRILRATRSDCTRNPKEPDDEGKRGCLCRGAFAFGPGSRSIWPSLGNRASTRGLTGCGSIAIGRADLHVCSSLRLPKTPCPPARQSQ